MLIDDYLPSYDAAERHHIHVQAPGEAVYRAVRALDLSDSFIIRSLFRLRELPAWLFSRNHPDARLGLTLDGMVKSGFILLGENPPAEILLGLAGRFWTAGGDLQRLPVDDFRTFNQPGYAKAVWNFSLAPAGDGRTRLTTETRVLCLDAASRRRFRAYWTFIRPFSGLTRIEMLRTVRRRAESGDPT